MQWLASGVIGLLAKTQATKYHVSEECNARIARRATQILTFWRRRSRSARPDDDESESSTTTLSTFHPTWATLSSPEPPPSLFSRDANCYSPRVPRGVPSTDPPSNSNTTLFYSSPFRPSSPSFPPFRNRRQPSISTGGPPKAQLGGAGKNYRPPSPTAVALASAAAQTQKAKKVVVNLPKETAPAVDGKPPERTHFARTPIPLHLVPPEPSVPPPDVLTATIHPEDSLRTSVPEMIDVFLPAKVSYIFSVVIYHSLIFLPACLGGTEEKVHRGEAGEARC